MAINLVMQIWTILTRHFNHMANQPEQGKYKMRSQFSPKQKGLPPELVSELNLIADIDKRILKVFEQGGGVLNISEVLVGYYQLYKTVKKRQYMMPTLYRMMKKGLLEATGNKGEYKLTSLNNKGE